MLNNIIRVLHVQMGMNRAGIETMIMNYFRHMDRTKIMFDFAGYMRKKCDYDDEIIRLGGRIFYYPKYNVYNHWEFVKWWEDFFDTHPEYKIVHGHSEGTYAIYLKIAKKHGCITIAHSHSAYGIEMPTPKSIMFKLSSLRTRSISHYFFGCSKQALIDKFGKKIARDRNRSKVINNAINVQKFSFDNYRRNIIREKMGLRKRLLVIGTVGRMERPKNPFFILNILKNLNARGADFIFLWCGIGKEEKKIKKWVWKNKLQEKVKLLGQRGDIENILLAMDVFIMPSLWEGLSVACIEAQASGLPIIVSDSVSQECDITGNCKFLPCDNADQWCNEIVKTSYDHVRINTYTQIVNAGYDISVEAKKLTDIYTNIERKC